MSWLVFSALLGLSGVGADTEVCTTCQPEVSDDAAMIQLARLGATGRRVLNGTEKVGVSGVGASTPWFPPAGPMPEQTGLIINEDGIENTYYLPGATIIDEGKTVKFEPPYRFYLMKTPTTDYGNANAFYKPAFVGKTFTIDIDFKKDGPGCGCNLNFYLVDMPAKTPGTEGDYYCDAQCFEGKGCCPEFDMNEGNKETQQITNHACTGKGSYNGHPDWECNKYGDPELKTLPSDFSPGTQNTINSDEPFTYSQRFDANGGDFIFTTTMTQEGRSKVLQMGPGNAQLNAMLKDLEKGMAFVTGYWFAEDMNWLDGAECGSGPEHCNQNPAYISNWRITTNAPPAPTPPTPPPPPGAGKCCWESGCSSCETNRDAWCNQDESTCTGSCSGQWCN